MKLYKLSILALALAGTMAACSDDDDYIAPAATPGAFFPVESPSVVELPFDGNSVDITVRRNSDIPADETFLLKSSDASGLFNIPSSVTFVGHETTAQIHVTYDPAKVETDKEYPASISIEGMANKWGITTYDFSFGRMTPYEYTKIGDSQWIYNGVLSGGGIYNVVKKVNANEPDIETYVVEGWFDYPTPPGVDLNLIVHKDCVLPNGYPWVEMPWTSTGFVNEGQLIKVVGWADLLMEVNELDFESLASLGFSLQNSSGNVLLSPEMMSYFDTDKGTFVLYDRYEAFDPNTDEDLGGWSAKYEYLYLPGYPEYDVDINYLGFFTNEDEELTAIGELYAGADVETVDVYNVAGDDVEAILNQIANGEIEGESITPESTDAIQVKFAVPGAGTYTMIAVANGDGEVQGYDYATYTIAGSAPVAGNWESIGEGVFIDGWVLPAYAINNVQLNPFDYPYAVEVEKNLDVEGEYRANLYGENFPLAGQNKNAKPVKVAFNISDPDWPLVPFQASGFSDGNMEWISDPNWYWENISGYSKDQVLGSNLAPKASYYEGGVLEVVLPLFAINDDDEFSSNIDDHGYNWNGNYPAQLTMPQGTKAATAAKAIRKAVSSDNFLRTVKAVKNNYNLGKRDRKMQIRSNAEFKKAENLQVR